MKPPPPKLRTPLKECPQWSTMQWVSATAMVRIDAKAKLLGTRRNGSRKDLVGIMVMYLAPEDPQDLWLLLDPYLRENKGARGKGGYAALMTRLPSPVSLRLDALVARAARLGTVFRQDLVGALAVRSLPDRDRLLELYERYHQATAGDAALDGMRKRDLLSPQPPQPGRRGAAAGSR